MSFLHYYKINLKNKIKINLRGKKMARFNTYYTSLEKKLCSMKSCKAVSKVLEQDNLHDLQSIDVLKMLAHKHAIAIYDTGLGKTFLASAIMKMLHNKEHKSKFIMFVTKNQLLQTPYKIKRLTNFDVICTDGTKDSIQNFIGKAMDYDVTLATYSCLASQAFLDFFFEHRNDYNCIIVDEAHKLNNFVTADVGAKLYEIIKKFEYAYALTATPITTDIEQLARLASIFDSETYHDYHGLQMAFKYNSYRISDDPCFFVSRNADAFGRVTAPHGIIVWTDPMPFQIDAEYSELSDLCKGEGATEQAEALAQLIQFNKSNGNERGLVYINRHKVREWVLPFLDEAGITYRCINGKTPNDERQKTLKEFNEEKTVDVVITSVTEALDLDCDYVIFYEFTANIKQMIGRAQRGFTDKDLFVFYIITDKTKEVDYFYNNVYKRCEIASYVLRKDYSEVLDLEDELLEHLTHPEQYVYRGW